MTEVFAKRLIMARKMASISMSELADKAGISKQAISQYEKGEMMPNGDNFIRIAEALNQDLDFFSRNTNASDLILAGNIHFRNKDEIDDIELSTIKANSIEILENYLELEKIADNRDDFSNPVKEMFIDSLEAAKEAAKKVRKKWKLGSLPLKNILSILESRGIKIIEISASESFNGFAAWAGSIPLIVVNRNFGEITRVRFTTLHELGHLVLKISEGLSEVDIERICDTFASELLLPGELLTIEVGNNRTVVSLQEVRAIKAKYGMSVHAIMYKLALNKIIGWDAYKRWKVYYNENKSDKSGLFGEYVGSEGSERFSKLLFKCISENKITLSKAASLSKFSISDLKEKISFDNNIYLS